MVPRNEAKNTYTAAKAYTPSLILSLNRGRQTNGSSHMTALPTMTTMLSVKASFAARTAVIAVIATNIAAQNR